jgi:hypothetical protein
MRWRHPTTLDERARIIRLAWVASFLVTLALIAVLAMARSAQALNPLPPAHPLALVAAAPRDEEDEEEEEGEAEAAGDDEYEAEECETGEEDEEECADEGDENTGEDSETPPECLLSSTRATIFATPNSGKVRLQVQYTSTSPAAVAVDYGLHGAKGSLYLGSDRKRFARQGALNLSRQLNEVQMAKVVAAKDFTVRFHVLDAPGYCQPLFDHHLDLRRATPNGLAWSDPESSFRR